MAEENSRRNWEKKDRAIGDGERSQCICQE